MNLFAGNVTIKGNKAISGVDFDYVENFSKTGDKVVFVFGDTDLKTSDEVVKMLIEKLGELKNYDISISTEDKMDMINSTYSEGVYELATFEGEQVDFAEINSRFSDFEEVVSIREAEVSEKFGNKVVKVDFVY